MKIKINYARISDSKELAKIDVIGNKELRGWEPNSQSDFIKIIKKAKYAIIIARVHEKIVGYLTSRLDRDSKWIWVEDVYVLKSYRKSNVAKELVKKLVNYWKKKSKRNIILLTGEKNLKIFNKMGFKKTMNFMEYKK